jgi:hypothetical protein
VQGEKTCWQLREKERDKCQDTAFSRAVKVLKTARALRGRGEVDPTRWTCHLDRRRRSAATEEEWRDPEDVGAALLMQGVLPE